MTSKIIADNTNLHSDTEINIHFYDFNKYLISFLNKNDILHIKH